MLRDLSALTYLEYRQIVNRVRETMRQPARALVYVIAMMYFVAITVARSHGHRAIAMKVIPEPYASAVMFTYLTLLGVMAYGAASGILGAFSSVADARFLTGSRIADRTVVVWLQLRRSGASVVRMLFTIVLYAFIFSGSGTVLGIGLATLGGTLVATAVAVPMLKLRNVIGMRTAQSLAGAVTAIGTLPMIILFASLVNPTALSVGIESLGAGRAFNQLFNGNALALGAFYVFGAALIAMAYVMGTGLYPDLYEASLRVLAFREKSKRGATAAFRMEHAYENRASRSAGLLFDKLSGPWTIAWKEWIAFSRSPSMQRVFWFGLAACAGCGALFGTVVARSNDPLAEGISYASITANMMVIFVAMGSAIGLAVDLRKPLWWMGPDPLWMRLFAWAVGTSWRLAACVCAAVVGWAIATRAPIIALAGIPLALAAVLYLRAVGLALYALFPSTIDQRGPLAFIRALLTYLLSAPPAIAGVVIGTVFHTLAGGVLTGLIVSVAETLALVAFASAQIAGRGVAVAQAEGM